MQTLDRGGITLAYQEAGTGDPPMVFIHGWTCDHTYFAPQFEHFKGSHRVVAVDLRGHGTSDKPEGEYPMTLFAEDVAAVLGQLDVEGAVVVGHSMGALVTVQLARSHPALVSRAVLVDPAPMAVPPEIGALLSQLTDNMEGPDPVAARRVVIDMLFIPTDDPELKERVANEMANAPAHVAVACFRGIGAFDGEDALGSLTIPVLVINSAAPINDPQRLASLCPSLTNEHTPGVGHFNQLLAPDEVNRLIAGFVG
ncbi:MAG: alpha/beta fold hydrolase [Acidimicrobiales bacterium]